MPPEGKMKCPLLTMYAVTLNKPDAYQDRDCLREECAWYNAEDDMCGVADIGNELANIQWELQELRIMMGRIHNYTG